MRLGHDCAEGDEQRGLAAIDPPSTASAHNPAQLAKTD